MIFSRSRLDKRGNESSMQWNFSVVELFHRPISRQPHRGLVPKGIWRLAYERFVDLPLRWHNLEYGGILTHHTTSPTHHALVVPRLTRTRTLPHALLGTDAEVLAPGYPSGTLTNVSLFRNRATSSVPWQWEALLQRPDLAGDGCTLPFRAYTQACGKLLLRLCLGSKSTK